jgi:hypothetical protein
MSDKVRDILQVSSRVLPTGPRKELVGVTRTSRTLLRHSRLGGRGGWLRSIEIGSALTKRLKMLRIRQMSRLEAKG